LTEGEPIGSHELFDRLTSKKTLEGDGEEEESELKYLHTIREIREKDPELFEQIKRLPKKARTAKVSQASSLRYFERQASSLRYIQQNHADDIICFDPEGNTEKRKRNLPHWQQEGNAYFITFRLYDSIPEKISKKITVIRLNSKVGIFSFVMPINRALVFHFSN